MSYEFVNKSVPRTILSISSSNTFYWTTKVSDIQNQILIAIFRNRSRTIFALKFMSMRFREFNSVHSVMSRVT
jgi:hypothetical protein